MSDDQDPHGRPFTNHGPPPPAYFTWPVDKPFPLTPEECHRLLQGYPVPWRGTFNEFLTELPGRWELVGGYLVPRNG